jgi:hypothetical protein
VRAAVLVAAALLAVGCGGEDEAGSEPRPFTVSVSTAERCEPVDGGAYELCYRANSGDHGRLYALTRYRTEVPIGTPASRGTLIGHWRKAIPSPDGRWLLLEWSAECEVPFTFLVPAAGGTPQPALGGGRRWFDAPSSTAVGWDSATTAIVEQRSSPCGREVATERVRVPVPD